MLKEIALTIGLLLGSTTTQAHAGWFGPDCAEELRRFDSPLQMDKYRASMELVIFFNSQIHPNAKAGEIDQAAIGKDPAFKLFFTNVMRMCEQDRSLDLYDVMTEAWTKAAPTTYHQTATTPAVPTEPWHWVDPLVPNKHQ